MTPTEAETLAVRMVRTWRGGPPADVWLEELTPLDAGAAGTAYARLRRSQTKPPTVAEFIKCYHSLVMVDGGRPALEECDRCEGTGWVEADPFYRNQTALGERPTSQVEPCSCGEGDRRRESSVWRERQR